MQDLSDEVKAYLASGDALVRAQLLQNYPQLRERLDSPDTIAKLLEWLSGNEPWLEANTALTINVLSFLRAHAKESDAAPLKALLLHPNALVRLRTYEYLLTLFFPDKNREALFMLFHGMLSDQSEQVRIEGVSYLERAHAVGELKPFLERWMKAAEERGLRNSESYERIERLLGL